jgi:oligoendopeptidase F
MLTHERTTDGPEERDEEIRRRAYERYLQRGGDENAQLDDWLNAERDVIEEQLAELDEE